MISSGGSSRALRARLGAVGALLTAAALVSAAPPASAAPPSNDDVVDAAPLPLDGTVEIEPGRATAEPGEAARTGCVPSGRPRAVWLAVTPEQTTAYDLTLDGALRYETQTLIGVFRGPADADSPRDLSFVDCANEPVRTNSAELAFTGTPGSTYYVQVGLTGRESDPGRVLQFGASVVERPVNDDFAGREAITDASGTVHLDNTLASPQRRDPRVIPRRPAGGHSLWYSWTAPADGEYRFSTGADLRTPDVDLVDTVLGIYTGTALGALQPVANDLTAPAGRPWAHTVVSAEAGRTYVVLVDSDPRADRFRPTGHFDLEWRPAR